MKEIHIGLREGIFMKRVRVVKVENWPKDYLVSHKLFKRNEEHNQP